MRHHAFSLKAFSKWLYKGHRNRLDALADLDLPGVVTQKERRALSLADAQRLILLTPGRKSIYALSGPDRATLYAVALNTGYRANELRHITPEDVNLGVRPSIAFDR
jgi:hypothetical protein